MRFRSQKLKPLSQKSKIFASSPIKGAKAALHRNEEGGEVWAVKAE